LKKIDIPTASYLEILEWIDVVYDNAEGDGLQIKGPTVEAVTDALLLLLHCHRSSSSFLPPPEIVIRDPSVTRFIDPYHSIDMYVCSNSAERSVIEALLSADPVLIWPLERVLFALF